MSEWVTEIQLRHICRTISPAPFYNHCRDTNKPGGELLNPVLQHVQPKLCWKIGEVLLDLLLKYCLNIVKKRVKQYSLTFSIYLE